MSSSMIMTRKRTKTRKRTSREKGNGLNYSDYFNDVFYDAIERMDEMDINDQDDFDDVFDEIYNDDSVTGNMSGSYTFNREQARDNVSDAIWNHDIVTLLHGYNVIVDDYLEEDNPEGLDVCIRCAMLDTIYEELKDHFEELVNEEN